MAGFSFRNPRRSAADDWSGGLYGATARLEIPWPASSGSVVDSLKIRYRPWICPLHELLGFVRSGDRVCDVGCGSGQFAFLLKKFTSVARILGIEVSPQLVANAQELVSSEPHAIPCEFKVYDGMEFPADVSACNLVFLVDVLHHVPRDRQQRFLRGLYDVMSVGSHLVLKDINKRSMLVMFNKLHDLVLAGATGEERSVREAQAMCRRAGFKVITAFTKRTVVYPHYVLVLEKLPGVATSHPFPPSECEP